MFQALALSAGFAASLTASASDSSADGTADTTADETLVLRQALAEGDFLDQPAAAMLDRYVDRARTSVE